MLVQVLDAPVPQMGHQLLVVLQKIDTRTPDQAIEVPKIFPDRVPQRLVECRPPQMAKQLKEVPTIVPFSSLQQRTVEQMIDIPVPGHGGGRGGLQGFSSGQNSTATPSSKKRISERIVEQIVDPVFSGGLHGSLSGHGSSSSHSPAGVEERAGEPGKGFFFALFPKIKKVRSWLRTRVRGCPPVAAHPRRLLSWRSRPCRTPSSGCSKAGKTFYWNRRARATVWKAPAGVEVVWIGDRTEEGVCYWHRDTRLSSSSWARSVTASPGRYTSTGRRAVFAVSRFSSP